MILTSPEEFFSISEKFNNKFIVLCDGVFDIFHYGHLIYLEESKKMGDVLIVSITSDRFVNKGENRPIFNTDQRISIINSLKIVDYCYISDDFSAINVIQKLKPDMYIKGMDVKGKEINVNENLFHEQLELNKIGGKLVFINTKDMFHSSNLIKYL